LAESGAHIVPAMPGFYFQPKSIDHLAQFMVERVAQSLGIEALNKENKIAWNESRL
jgi:4-hydroxy-3-polyprenylbenzoate decarboxylase